MGECEMAVAGCWLDRVSDTEGGPAGVPNTRGGAACASDTEGGPACDSDTEGGRTGVSDAEREPRGGRNTQGGPSGGSWTKGGNAPRSRTASAHLSPSGAVPPVFSIPSSCKAAPPPPRSIPPHVRCDDNKEFGALSNKASLSCLYLRASSRGVAPAASGRVGHALHPSSARAVRMHPQAAARCSAVRPNLSVV